MSSIRERSGKLVFDFTFNGIRCRETSRLKDSPSNRKIANEILTRIDAEIIVGTFCYEKYFPKSKRIALFGELAELKVKKESNILPTLAEFTAIWLQENSGGWRPTYLYKLNGMFNKYILPNLGSINLRDITKSDILLFRNELVAYKKSNGKPMTSYNVNRIMMKLKAVLAEASERFAIDNVSSTVKPLKNEVVEVSPLSLNQVINFLDLVRDDYHCYFTLRFFTGLRSSEVTALKWDDIYIEQSYLMVRGALVNGEIINTKTVGSYRKVELNKLVIDSLSEHKKLSNFSNKTDFVFCTHEGNHVNNNNICARIWHPMLRLLNLKPRKLYQTRHTTASFWLASGESPEWIAKQMGHSSTALLFSTYSRFIANNTQKDGSRFDSFLSQSSIGNTEED
jgi:integrase